MAEDESKTKPGDQFAERKLSKSGEDYEKEAKKKGRFEIQDEDQLIAEIGFDLTVDCLVKCPRSEYASVSLLNKKFRSLLKSGYLYEQRRRLGISEPWIYFSSMPLDREAFDPARRKWISVPKFKADYCFTNSEKESQAVGTQLLVFGKDIFRQIIYKYDLLTSSWSFGMTLSHQRCQFASASSGEIAIFAGGSDHSTGEAVCFVEQYNSETGMWHELPGLSIPRKLGAGFFMDGNFYVIGGKADNNSKDLITTGEVYNLKSNTWCQIPNMCPPMTDKPAPLLAVVDNELYAAYPEQLELWKYGKKANTWKKIGKLPYLSSTYGWGIGFRSCGNLLVVVGEKEYSIRPFVTIYAWEPKDGAAPRWRVLGTKCCGGSFVYTCAIMGC